jgi:hypothetical protein
VFSTFNIETDLFMYNQKTKYGASDMIWTRLIGKSSVSVTMSKTWWNEAEKWIFDETKGQTGVASDLCESGAIAGCVGVSPDTLWKLLHGPAAPRKQTREYT